VNEAHFVPKAITPTAEQLAIQTASQRTIVVEANAGAAKTTTLALRLAESLQRGIPVDRTLALTYTEPACDAMRAALKKIGLPPDVIRRLRISTFESFASGFLRRWEGAAVPLLSRPEELKPYVQLAIARVGDNAEERWRDELVFPATGDAAVEDFLRESLHLKGTMQLQREAADEPITPALADALGRSYAWLKTFSAYEHLRRGGHPDRPLFRGPFDATYDLARSIVNHQIAPDEPGWPTGLRVLLLDEMHDVNQAMFELLHRLLSANTQAFFCGAGDRDQVIHKLTGADAAFMGDALAATTSRAVERYPLTASYRFGPKLAALASRIARKPYASASAHETVVAVHRYSEAEPCEPRIVDEAQQWQRKAGARKMSEFAVLLRHGHQSVALENHLLEAELPYTMRGLRSYLQRPEILLLRGLLAVATADFSSVQDPATRQSILEAFVFFGDIRITVHDDAEHEQAALLKEAVQAVVEDPNILTVFFENQVLRNAEPAVARRMRAAVDAARSQRGPELLAQVFEALQPRWLAARVLVEAQRLREVEGNMAGLQAHARQFASADALFHSLNQAELRQRSLKNAHSLVLASVESVKGLEFDHVLLPYLAQRVFPDADAPADDERNLFYVGITRARQRLTLYASERAPSRFLSVV